MDQETWAAQALLSGKTLLVVEKEYFLMDDARQMITKFGALIVTADSVATAMSLIDRNAPDGAILDIDMNPDDAFTLAERLDQEKVPYVFACCEAFALQAPTFGGFVLRGSVQALNDISLALFARVTDTVN